MRVCVYVYGCSQAKRRFNDVGRDDVMGGAGGGGEYQCRLCHRSHRSLEVRRIDLLTYRYLLERVAINFVY